MDELLRAPNIRRLAAALLIAAACFAFWAALQPKLTPPSAYHADKIVHILAFAVLGGLAALARTSRRWLLLAVLALTGLGALIEIGQSMVPGRSASLNDLLGDIIGIGVGVAAVEVMLPFLSKLVRN
ncbi:VanZ family protein [Azospirillum sp. SYSU D00513]|uniref:VanZ family protein n=1 Tax=Azospirillum sp. SYSU D00513 TaxID=2812561 RepID=UPI001A959146|nr:VanZ family protein [Azospirillum sp. SYSU D00513]